jgi:ABC-2 type transport system permease protein
MTALHIAGRIIRQMIGDRRSLALVLIVPLFLMTLIYLLLGDSGYRPTVGAAGLPDALVSRLQKQDLTVRAVGEAAGKDEVRARTLDALVTENGGRLTLLFETNDAVKTGKVQKEVQAAVKALSPAAASASLKVQFLYGSTDESMFDSLGYVMLGIVSFFLIFILAGISFVRERTSETLTRMMLTPVRRWQVVLGYTIGFGCFAVLQSVLLLTLCVWVLRMPFAGPVAAAGLVMIALAVSAVCIGAFFSIFSQNEFQVMQFIPVVVIPQIFFSGLIPLDTLPLHLGAVSKIMPVFYACDALRIISVRGGGPADVLPDLLALSVFIAGFFALNILALRRYRRV